MSVDGLEGDFWEHGLSSWLEYFHRQSVHNLLWQFIPIRDYSSAERMLAATFKIWPVEAAKTWKRMESWEGLALFCTNKQGRHGFFHGLGKKVAAAGGLSHRGRGAALLQTSPQIFEHCLAPGNPGRGWGRVLALHVQDAGKKQWGEDIRVQRREGSL